MRLQDADTEGAQIIEQGPLCAMYSRRMFKDIEATDALANADNRPKTLYLALSKHEGLGSFSIPVDE